jgi:hypothetical protein
VKVTANVPLVVVSGDVSCQVPFHWAGKPGVEGAADGASVATDGASVATGAGVTTGGGVTTAVGIGVGVDEVEPQAATMMAIGTARTNRRDSERIDRVPKAFLDRNIVPRSSRTLPGRRVRLDPRDVGVEARNGPRRSPSSGWHWSGSAAYCLAIVAR